jgi:hypothetical protein
MSTNYEVAFADRPRVLAAWMQLNGSIKESMDLGRYELATLAAARRLRSSYCCLAPGTGSPSGSASRCGRSHSPPCGGGATTSTRR